MGFWVLGFGLVCFFIFLMDGTSGRYTVQLEPKIFGNKVKSLHGAWGFHHAAERVPGIWGHIPVGFSALLPLESLVVSDHF